MFSYIVSFVSRNKQNDNLFHKKYRQGYNKLWINSIKNYTP